MNIITILGFALIILFIVGFLVFFLHKKIKRIKISNIYFISGAVKTGKSLVMVFLGLIKYFEIKIAYYIRRFLMRELRYITFDRNIRIIEKCEYLKKNNPILISNMPIRFVRFYRFTMDILLQQVRIPDKSVLLLDETSLIADSMNYKDKRLNDKLLKFYKLWGHYSHGSYLICNSQSWLDNHLSLKRCMNKYLYTYENIKIPFFVLVKVREMFYSEDNNQVNVNNGDIQNNMLTLIVPKFIFKMYDPYYLSAFTDDLAYYDEESYKLGKHDSLKVKELVSLQSFAENMNKEINKNEA